MIGCVSDQTKWEKDKNHCVLYYGIEDIPENQKEIERCVYITRYDKEQKEGNFGQRLQKVGRDMRNSGQNMMSMDRGLNPPNNQTININDGNNQNRKVNCQSRVDSWGNVNTQCK